MVLGRAMVPFAVFTTIVGPVPVPPPGVVGDTDGIVRKILASIKARVPDFEVR